MILTQVKNGADSCILALHKDSNAACRYAFVVCRQADAGGLSCHSLAYLLLIDSFPRYHGESPECTLLMTLTCMSQVSCTRHGGIKHGCQPELIVSRWQLVEPKLPCICRSFSSDLSNSATDQPDCNTETVHGHWLFMEECYCLTIVHAFKPGMHRQIDKWRILTMRSLNSMMLGS